MPTDAAGCAAAGGRWRETSMLNSKMLCDLRTSDGGKPCRSSSECESRCVRPGHAPSFAVGTPVAGVCDDYYQSIGRCRDRVENGVVVLTMCAD